MITCAKCQLQYKTVKIGTALEVMTTDNQPYQLFAGDRMECPGCGHVIVRTGTAPIAAAHEARYPAFVKPYAKRDMLDRAWTTAKEKEKAGGWR
jgi:hypothetical protein